MRGMLSWGLETEGRRGDRTSCPHCHALGAEGVESSMPKENHVFGVSSGACTTGLQQGLGGAETTR